MSALDGGGRRVWDRRLPRRNAHVLRPAEGVLRNDLARLVSSGVRVSFVAEVARMCRTQVGGVLRGSIPMVTERTYTDLLEAICRIDAGEVEVPLRGRRQPGAAVLPRQGADNRCGSGLHEMTEANTYVTPAGIRNCRECVKAAKRRYVERKRAERAAALAAAAPEGPRLCKAGLHPMEGPDALVYIDPRSRARRCVECRREQQRARLARRRAASSE